MIYQLDDGDAIKVKVKKNKIKVQAFAGYCSGVKDLLVLENNGNGYYVRSKSYLSTQSDRLFNLDYAEIEYLYYAYKAVLEEKENKNGN